MTPFNYTAYCGAVDQSPIPDWPSELQQCFLGCIGSTKSFQTDYAEDLKQRISDLLSIWPRTQYGNYWLDVLCQPIFELAQSKWWCQLSKQGYLAFPARKDIFNFARYCFPREVKVVIVGQDPYPNENAHGLAFSVQEGKIPPSLNNIFKLLERTIPGFIRNTGDLTLWADQGVLLLNSVLTYPRGCYISHMGQGCEIFTDAVIEYIDENNEYVVFMLWGEEAKAKSKLIKNKMNLVLETSHPGNQAAHLGFLKCAKKGTDSCRGCDHFNRCNAFLGKHGKKVINWRV